MIQKQPVVKGCRGTGKEVNVFLVSGGVNHPDLQEVISHSRNYFREKVLFFVVVI